MKLIQQTGRPVIGVLLCVTAAMAIALFAGSHPWRIFVPLAFVFVIVLLAEYFGMAVSLFGSVLAAFIFAYVLFAPVNSVRVESRIERENLAWMLLAGIVIPYLLLPGRLRPGGRQ